MKNKIIPSLWFTDNAGEAMQFYVDIFSGEIFEENSILVRAKLAGIEFLALNGRPSNLKPNPSISFMFVSDKKEEISKIYEKLCFKGNVLMQLGSYSWSDYYAWVVDRYGFSWQVYFGKYRDVHGQCIVPTLMFANTQQGNCRRAVNFYQEVFKDFSTDGILPYQKGPYKDQIQHTQFVIDGFVMAAMDSGEPNDFHFNEAISHTISCKNQAEIDYYWDKFTEAGSVGQCGWCKDPFGISWQIAPSNISKLLFENPNSTEAMAEMRKMKKIIVKDLEKVIQV